MRKPRASSDRFLSPPPPPVIKSNFSSHPQTLPEEFPREFQSEFLLPFGFHILPEKRKKHSLFLRGKKSVFYLTHDITGTKTNSEF